MYLQPGGGGKGIRPNQQQQQHHQSAHHHLNQSTQQQPQQQQQNPNYQHQHQSTNYRGGHHLSTNQTHSQHYPPPHHQQTLHHHHSQQQQQQQHQQHQQHQQQHQQQGQRDRESLQQQQSSQQDQQRQQPSHLLPTPQFYYSLGPPPLSIPPPSTGNGSQTSSPPSQSSNNGSTIIAGRQNHGLASNTFPFLPPFPPPPQTGAVMAIPGTHYNNNGIGSHTGQSSVQNAATVYATPAPQHQTFLGPTPPTALHPQFFNTNPPGVPLNAMHPVRGLIPLQGQGPRHSGQTILIPSHFLTLPPNAATRPTIPGANGAAIAMGPMLQHATRGPPPNQSPYVTPSYCQPPLALGANTVPQVSMMGPPSVPSYAPVTPVTVSTAPTAVPTMASMTQCTGTEMADSTKKRTHAIPIIHPVTFKNIMDPNYVRNGNTENEINETETNAVAEENLSETVQQDLESTNVDTLNVAEMPPLMTSEFNDMSSAMMFDPTMNTDYVPNYDMQEQYYEPSEHIPQFEISADNLHSAITTADSSPIHSTATVSYGCEGCEEYDDGSVSVSVELKTSRTEYDSDGGNDIFNVETNEFGDPKMSQAFEYGYGQFHIDVDPSVNRSQIGRTYSEDQEEEPLYFELQEAAEGNEEKEESVQCKIESQVFMAKDTKQQQDQHQQHQHHQIQAQVQMNKQPVQQNVQKSHDFIVPGAAPSALAEMNPHDSLNRKDRLNKKQFQQKSNQQPKPNSSQPQSSMQLQPQHQMSQNKQNLSGKTQGRRTMSPQKSSPATSGISSATSTPTHQLQNKQRQGQQQNLQRNASVTSSSTSPSGAGPTNPGGGSKKNKKSKRQKESQKKIKQQQQQQQQQHQKTHSDNNRKGLNNNNNSFSNNNAANQNNKSNNNNVSTINNLASTSSLTVNPGLTLGAVVEAVAAAANTTDKNNANSISSISNNSNIRIGQEPAGSAAANLRNAQHKRQQTSYNIPPPPIPNVDNKSLDLTCLPDFSVPPPLIFPPPLSFNKINAMQQSKVDEIVAEYLKPEGPDGNRSEDTNLQFLNSSCSACEDEDTTPQHVNDEYKKQKNAKKIKAETDAVDSSIAKSQPFSENDITVNVKNQTQPTQPIRYSSDELKAFSKSPASLKPPLVPCQKGDCISQLFVSRQQYHGHHNLSHSMPGLVMHPHLQQYQQMNFNEQMDFVPGKRRNQQKKQHDMQHHYMVAAGGGSMDRGKSGNAARHHADIIHVNLSLREEIKLSECENAWTPDTLRGRVGNNPTSNSSSNTEEDIDSVLKKVRGVLNKLTPENFDVLLKTMSNISMNTQEKMQQVMLLIFEKTVSEPNFAPTYAKFCKMIFQEVKAENKPLFTNLLISRIQQEFETNVNDANAKKLKLKPLIEKLEGCTDPKERVEIQAEVEDQEYQFRRRAWGTVRFIGEMYKLQSLTSDRVFICIESLLDHGCEEKLEYMCKLLTTVGHLLEGSIPDHNSKSNPSRMDSIFQKMQDFVKKSRHGKSNTHAQAKISSRVRFMMQDVIDMRNRHWDQPRRTLKSDKDEKDKYRDNNASISNNAGNHDRNTQRSGYGHQGGGGRQSGKHGDQSYHMQRQHKGQNQSDAQKLNIDLNKLKFSRNEDATQLGNASLYMWRTAGKHQQSNIAPTIGAMAPTMKNSLGSIPTPSTSAQASFGTNVKNVQILPFDTKNSPRRSNSTTGNATAMSHAKGKRKEEVSAFSSEECQKIINTIIEEVLEGNADVWHEEANNAWFGSNFDQQTSLLRYVLMHYLHLGSVKRPQRQACAKIFSFIMGKDLFNKKVFTQAYEQFSDGFADLLVDVPNGWSYIFEFLGPIMHERLLNFNDIWLPEWSDDSYFTDKFLKAFVSYFTSEFGVNYVRKLWHHDYKLDRGQKFIKDAEQWREFIAVNNYQFIYEENIKPPQAVAKKDLNSNNSNNNNHKSYSSEHIKRIEFLLNTSNNDDLAIDYVSTNVNINTSFISNLTQFLCCDFATVMQPSPTRTTDRCNTPSGGIKDTKQQKRKRCLNADLFRSKCVPLLRLCIDAREAHEIPCLNAVVDSLQDNYDTETANELTCGILDLLYDNEVIAKESFEKWYRCRSSDSNSALNPELQAFMEKLL